VVRVSERLNAALHGLLTDNPSAYLLGEDIADPYGGAFKVSRGLSTQFPDRVMSTPISEAGIVGAACGLALTGNVVVVEVMFGDFLPLAFDQILNFASKSVSMYGRELPMRMIVRCPSGGRRGYGATHSQSLQKHFLGIPNLDVYELSALHDPASAFAAMIESGRPSLFVEDKSLYGEQMVLGARVDDVFRRMPLGGGQEYMRLYVDSPGDLDHLIIATGGTLQRAVAAARRLLVQHEQVCQIVVPSRLYPVDVAPLEPLLAAAKRIAVVEESTAGGTWGAEVAIAIYDRMWGRLAQRVRLVSSADSVIPAARHLEEQVIVSEQDIFESLRRAGA
jgi:pyruvate/2-oxoglutarate/acetoin dehydrogenase E1 component